MVSQVLVRVPVPVMKRTTKQKLGRQLHYYTVRQNAME